MKVLNIIMEPLEKPEDTNFRIFLPNNVDYSWSDEDVLEDLKKLDIVLENNAILKFGDKTYYGWEDDGQIGFTIPTDELLYYAADIIQEG